VTEPGLDPRLRSVDRFRSALRHLDRPRRNRRCAYLPTVTAELEGR
jgi:hypothetical protein